MHLYTSKYIGIILHTPSYILYIQTIYHTVLPYYNPHYQVSPRTYTSLICPQEGGVRVTYYIPTVSRRVGK